MIADKMTTGTLGAAEASHVIGLDGINSVGVNISGTFTGTAVFEASVDKANWVAVFAYNPTTRKAVASVAAAATLVCNVGGFRKFRVRCSAYTSGTIEVTTNSDSRMINQSDSRLDSSDLGLTVTAAAGVGGSLTIPAPGAGLFQYVTMIEITKFAAALLVAGAAPDLVTTTNIPGLPIFSFNKSAMAAGTVENRLYMPCRPMKAALANTAILITVPAITDVIWRINATYYAAA